VSPASKPAARLKSRQFQVWRPALLNEALRKLMLLCVISSGLNAVAQEKTAGVVWMENFEHGLGKEWKELNFSGKTVYTIVSEGTNHVLKSSASRSASGLAHEVSAPGNLLLSWRWKIEKVPPGASETDIAKFDHVARIFVA